jgi:EpsI family protein
MPAGRFLRVWLIAALACAVALVCWPSSVIFAEKWVDTVGLGYTHGWLILVICTALVVRSRRQIAAAPARPSARAQLMLAAAVLAWLVSYRASIETLELPLVPLIFLLSVTAAFGWAVGRLLLFPVAYFYFAVPTWYPQPLQYLTVLVVHGMLRLTGPPAEFAGDVIHLSNGSFVIEEGCSGMHFMIVGLAVAALYGERQRDPWRIRALQLTLMAGLALLANWVRVYTVIEAGYLTDMQSYLVRVSHYGFGWGVFAVALALFFWLVRGFAPAEAAEAAPAATPLVHAADLATPLAGVAGAVVILVALPLLSAGARVLHPAPPAADTATRVDPPPSWRAVPVDTRSTWRPVFPGADALQRRAFGNADGDTVELFGAAYRTQRQGAELVGESSSLFGEELEVRAQHVISTPAGVFNETEVAERGGARSLIWWRYHAAGRDLVTPFLQQLWYGLNALVWSPPAALIALRTACRARCEPARRKLREFVTSGGLGAARREPNITYAWPPHRGAPHPAG